MYEHEINRVVLSGRLVSDPDVHELPDGTPACVLHLRTAMRRRIPGAAHGTVRELPVLVLGPKACRIAPYLYAGRQVIVLGRLEAERWEAGEGPEREALCVLAERVSFVGPPPIGVGAPAGSGHARSPNPAPSICAAVGFSEDMWSA
jgi:single-stranded DNA-binding protein